MEIMVARRLHDRVCRSVQELVQGARHVRHLLVQRKLDLGSKLGVADGTAVCFVGVFEIRDANEVLVGGFGREEAFEKCPWSFSDLEHPECVA